MPNPDGKCNLIITKERIQVAKEGGGERMLSTRKGEGRKDGLIFLCACRYIKLWHSLGDGERSSQEALVSGKWTCHG